MLVCMLYYGGGVVTNVLECRCGRENRGGKARFMEY